MLQEVINKDNCGTFTVEQISPSVRLEEWLGDSQWDGTGRVSGGTSTVGRPRSSEAQRIPQYCDAVGFDGEPCPLASLLSCEQTGFCQQ